VVGRPPARSLFALFAALVLLSFSLAGAASSQNDAGSGGDVGSTWATAYGITVPGAYEGNLTSGDAGDVYKWLTPTHVGQPYCAEADLTTQTAVDADLVVVNKKTGAATESLAAAIVTNNPSHVGAVNLGADGGFVNVTPDPLSTGVSDEYRFQLTTLTASQLPPGDGGSGRDAGATPAGAVALPAACFGGKLDGQGDTVDTYAFNEAAGNLATFSLADTTGGATGAVLDAAGHVLASVPTDGLTSLQLPSTGTYYFAVSAPAATTYVAGLCDPQCGPPEAPCNPNCVSALM
jgi:hypothetical protein